MSKKRSLIDLDGVHETVLPLINTDLATGSLEPSSSTDKRHKTFINLNRPSREILVKSREIVVYFYKIQMLNVLRRMYARMCKEEFHKLNDDLCDKLERKFEELKASNNCTNYWLHQDWLDSQVTTLTTNIVAKWTYYTDKKEDASDLTNKERDMVVKLREI